MTISQFLDQLKDQNCVPFLPDMSLESLPTFDEGIVLPVTEEVFDWFLGVLPPRWINGSSYAFGEGYDPFRLFWQDREGFFGVQLSQEQTEEFRRLTGAHQG